MRAYEFLTESPLPDDWDKDVYKSSSSYKKRIEYAVQRLKQHGKGSARTAFTYEYQGRQTILKVAHNAKGVAQNEVEAKILTDSTAPYILIPIIDHADNYAWIHTEFAHKATDAQLCKLLGTPSMGTLTSYAGMKRLGDTKFYRDEMHKILENLPTDTKTFEHYANQLSILEERYGILLYDLRNSNNWGIYNNRPVIIDIGFTDTVVTTHYGR